MAKSSITLQIGRKELVTVDTFFVCGTNSVTGFCCYPRSTAILLACVAVYFSFSCPSLFFGEAFGLKVSSLLCR